MSVDASAIIPQSIRSVGVHKHSEHILLAVVRDICDIVAESGVAAQMVAQEIAIEIHFAVALNSVEIYPD